MRASEIISIKTELLTQPSPLKKGSSPFGKWHYHLLHGSAQTPGVLFNSCLSLPAASSPSQDMAQLLNPIPNHPHCHSPCPSSGYLPS